jgi:hypothetical protein
LDPGTASLPGPQSRRGTSPIEAAPIAALPINVSTTRRERFMVVIPVLWRFRSAGSFHHLRKRTQAKARRFTASCGHSAAGEMSGEGMRKRTEAAALHAARA